jgi:hypothetical protein
MHNLENNEEFEIADGAGVSKATYIKKPKTTINDLEASIIARSEDLNIPALCAFFGVTDDVVKIALTKK